MHGRLRILADWGTSTLRTYLCEDESVLAQRTGLGIGMLKRPAIEELLGVVDDWLQRSGGCLWLCGMAGSRNGVFEVPYADAPCDADDWRQQALTRSAAAVRMTVTAGLRCKNFFGLPDVMRGEETQIFGALRKHRQLTRGVRFFVLPGTHSKWAIVEDGRIRQFHTALTGELYALLRDHSSLFKVRAAHSQPVYPVQASEDLAAFDAGLARARTAAGLQTSVFEARSVQLLLDRSARWAEQFLSGLLIGQELTQMRTLAGEVAEVILVGDAIVRAPYHRALEASGIRVSEMEGHLCAISGLLSLVEHQ